MYLLGPFYQWLVQLFDGRVNHLPLVRLFIFSVDHAIILFIGWLIVWSIYLSSRKKGEISWKWELYRNLFIFYIILFAQLTIFRSTMRPLRYKSSRTRSRILCGCRLSIALNYLCKVRSLQRIINVVGNIVWFMPLGFFCGLLYGKKMDNLARSGTGSGPLLRSSFSIYLLHRSQPYR